MYRAGCTTRLVILLSLILVSGCAQRPATPGPAGSEPAERQNAPADRTPAPLKKEGATRPHDTRTQDPRRTDAPCSGRFQRGIAYLMRLEGDRAWFEFVPGDRKAALPAQPDWRIGREFRAEWFMPDPAQTRCRERLELVAPLP